jgi:hypothetical protein
VAPALERDEEHQPMLMMPTPTTMMDDDG